MRSDIVGRTVETESYAHSLRIYIQDFGKMVANVQCANTGDGDKCAFAGKHFNVVEIPALSNDLLLLTSEDPVHNEYSHESLTTSSSKSNCEATRDIQEERGSKLQEFSCKQQTTRSFSDKEIKQSFAIDTTEIAKENALTSPCASALLSKTQFVDEGFPGRNGANGKTRMSLAICDDS